MVQRVDAAAPAPVHDGFFMPAEWEPHKRTWMCWPTRMEAFGDDDRFLRAKQAYARVARAISGFEPVIVIARRSGQEWWLGAMTDWTPRDIELPLAFLGDGGFSLESWADGINADRTASDLVRSAATATRSDTLKLHLAPGGGWAARIKPNR